MAAEQRPLQVPVGVVSLLQRAVSGEALARVESMALALTETGWVRGRQSGSWSSAADASWTVESGGHPPSLSIFVRGSDGKQEEATDALRDLLDDGRAGLLSRAAPAWSWSRWLGGGVEVSLSLSRQSWLGSRRVPAMMQLAVERADAPVEGAAPDAQSARRIAADGSAVARWYLAGQDHLPDDVVATLAADDNPSVVTALELNDEPRRIARGEL